MFMDVVRVAVSSSAERVFVAAAGAIGVLFRFLSLIVVVMVI